MLLQRSASGLCTTHENHTRVLRVQLVDARVLRVQLVDARVLRVQLVDARVYPY